MKKHKMPHNLIIGITGASGVIYGIKLLEEIARIEGISSHLIISPAAKVTIIEESEYQLKQLKELADHTYNHNDIAALIASGSFKTMGMIIAPCSINTMSKIATGNTDNLLTRAADVVLKEKRKLLLCLRETPLHSLHLNNMKNLSDLGAVIFPPVPAFYLKPKTINDIVDHTVGRMLSIFDIASDCSKVWSGLAST